MISDTWRISTSDKSIKRTNLFVAADTIVSTYLYIDYYSIIWINDYLCFRSIIHSETNMTATQRQPTRRVSSLARSKRGSRVSTTVEYKIAAMYFWS